MKKMREVIRLKMSNDFSDRKIARALNISRPVVTKYWRGFQASGLKFEQKETMADSKQLQILEKRPRVQKQKCDKYKRLIDKLGLRVVHRSYFLGHTKLLQM